MDSYGVLKMCGGLGILRAGCPLVGLEIYVFHSHRYHRLDSNAQAVLNLRAIATATIVGHLRIFVHLPTNAMSHKLTNYAVARTLAVGLHCIADIADSMTNYSGFNAAIERFLCYAEQLSCSWSDGANLKGIARIAVIASN